jgi:hypothetical protein
MQPQPVYTPGKTIVNRYRDPNGQFQNTVGMTMHVEKQRQLQVILDNQKKKPS